MKRGLAKSFDRNDLRYSELRLSNPVSPDSTFSECCERRCGVPYGELGAREIEVALLARGHVQGSVTLYFHFLKRSRPECDVLTAATGIRSAAVIASGTIRSNGDDPCAERTSRAMPMLHGKLLGLRLRFCLPALLLLLLGVFLFFLLNISLHLSQFRAVGEIPSELKNQSSCLIVVVTLAGGLDTAQLMGKDLLFDLSGSGVAQTLRLARPKQRTVIGRTDILSCR